MSQKIEKPRCVSILTCGDVLEDKRSNCKTLVNLFNQIHSSTYPTVKDKLCLYVAVTNGVGKWPMELCITRPDGEILFSVNGEFHFDDPVTVFEFVYELRLIRFPSWGVYVVDLKVDGEPIAETRLVVTPKSVEANNAE